MSSTLVLDASPLGRLVFPDRYPDIKQWLGKMVASGRRVVLPELSDYEARRGILYQKRAQPNRALPRQKIERLDELTADLYYAPLTTEHMRRASDVWADARASGQTFAPDEALSGDAILIAQAESFGDEHSVTVITANARHLTPYVTAMRWQNFEA